MSTGESIILRSRSACAAASAGLLTMNASPWPARAMPTIKWRLTLVPIPNANTLLRFRFFAISWKTSFSTVT